MTLSDDTMSNPGCFDSIHHARKNHIIRAYTSKIAYLVATLVTFDVFPNLNLWHTIPPLLFLRMVAVVPKSH